MIDKTDELLLDSYNLLRLLTIGNVPYSDRVDMLREEIYRKLRKMYGKRLKHNIVSNKLEISK